MALEPLDDHELDNLEIEAAEALTYTRERPWLEVMRLISEVRHLRNAVARANEILAAAEGWPGVDR